MQHIFRETKTKTSIEVTFIPKTKMNKKNVYSNDCGAFLIIIINTHPIPTSPE